jgi:hypothetical protein
MPCRPRPSVGASDEVKYLESLLTEYARAFQSRLHFVEEARYEKRRLRRDFEKAAGARAVEVRTQRTRAAHGHARGRSAADGRRRSAAKSSRAEALDKRGLLHPRARWRLIGPVAIFSTPQRRGGRAAAAGTQQGGSERGGGETRRGRGEHGCWFRPASGRVGVDPTLGNASSSRR